MQMTPPSILDPLAPLVAECEAADSVRAVTASDWLSEADEPDKPIATGLFDCGDRVAIVGQSKARKSFYAQQLAVALATATPFLGVETFKQRTLLINGEIQSAKYKKRLRSLLARLAIAPTALDGLVVVNASEDVFAWDFNRVLTLAQKHAAQVVIVDPVYLLLGDEVNQTEVKQCVRDMKRFAAEGITLVSVFHATKGLIGDRQDIDRIAGSGIFARDAATMLTLCEHASEPDHVVVKTRTRNYPPAAPTTIRFCEGAFDVTDIEAVEKTSRTKPKRVFSVEQLRACFSDKESTYGDTLTRMMQVLGCGRDRAKAEIARAVNEGVANAETRGRPTFYTIKPDVD